MTLFVSHSCIVVSSRLLQNLRQFIRDCGQAVDKLVGIGIAVNRDRAFATLNADVGALGKFQQGSLQASVG